MKAIFGLGNPGLRFRLSRHNLGFLVVERLARARKIKIGRKVFNCRLGQGRLDNQGVILAQPLTFVNLSGQVICSIVKGKKIALKDLLIICDDVNLPLGKVRIRPKGSDGGHKGLRSIIELLGTKNFPRLRIGVGTPAFKSEAGLSKYVLGHFNKRESRLINQAIDEAVACSEVWVKEGTAIAMNKFN